MSTDHIRIGGFFYFVELDNYKARIRKIRVYYDWRHLINCEQLGENYLTLKRNMNQSEHGWI